MSLFTKGVILFYIFYSANKSGHLLTSSTK